MEAFLIILIFVCIYIVAVHYGLKLLRWMFKQ